MIEDRNNEIESLKKTIELLSNKDEVNRLNKKLSERIDDYLSKIEKLVQENEKLSLDNATLLTHHYIIKAKTNRYFRKLNNIEEDENTHDLDQWIVDEDLVQDDEDNNREAIKQQNEETKSDIIEILKEEQTIKEQSDEINNLECFKTLKYIRNILGNFIF